MPGLFFALNLDAEKLIFRKLGEMEVGKECQNKISNRFAALENFIFSEDINRAWETLKGKSQN